MDSIIFPDSTIIERIAQLEATAVDQIENHTYYRQLTPDEIADEQVCFSALHIDIQRTNERKRQIMAEFSAELKLLTEKAKLALAKVEQGRELITETVYVVQDFDEKLVGYYNNRGQLIETHKMLAKEMQHGIQFPAMAKVS